MILINDILILVLGIVAGVVGVVFGLYSARNASKLQPVDALRTE